MRGPKNLTLGEARAGVDLVLAKAQNQRYGREPVLSPNLILKNDICHRDYNAAV
jgi:hypothetical protein